MKGIKAGQLRQPVNGIAAISKAVADSHQPSALQFLISRTIGFGVQIAVTLQMQAEKRESFR